MDDYFYEFDSITINNGELATFSSYHPLQRSVVPLYAKVGNQVKGIGTAVCVALDCFVTARHVVAEYNYDLLPPEIEIHREHMWVYVETEMRAQSDPEAVVGGILDVTWTNAHHETDLATLTVKTNTKARQWLRPVTLALRMPSWGEPVAAFGYNHLLAEGTLDGPPDEVVLTLERNFSAGVGRVVEHQLERRLTMGLHRTSPGFRTNTPTFSGMSGGPVFDLRNEVIGFNSGSNEPNDDSAEWDSFVSGAASALELNFRLPPGTTTEEPVSMSELVGRGLIRCQMYDTFDVDPKTGDVRYLDPDAVKADDRT